MLPRIDVALLLPDGFFPSEAFCSLRASVLLTFSQLGLVVCLGESRALHIGADYFPTFGTFGPNMSVLIIRVVRRNILSHRDAGLLGKHLTKRKSSMKLGTKFIDNTCFGPKRINSTYFGRFGALG